MTPDEMSKKAVDLFLKRFHCSQAVLAAGLEKAGMVNEEAVKTVGLFGGGLAGTGRICGVLVGCTAFISSVYSRGNLEGKEDPRMWKLGRELSEKFEELTRSHGGVNCRDIARVDWKDRKSVQEFYSSPDSRRSHCIQLVGDIASVLGEMIEREKIGI